MAKKIRVVVKEVGKAPEIRVIEENLETFQKIVGGYIELAECDWLKVGDSFPFHEGYDILLNEEGKLEGLEPNMSIGYDDVIAGTFIILKGDGEGGHASLSENEADSIIKRLMQ